MILCVYSPSMQRGRQIRKLVNDGDQAVEIATEQAVGAQNTIDITNRSVRRGVRDMRDGICCRWGSLGLEYIC